MPDPSALPTVEVVTVYGADWCSDCRRTRQFLESSGAPYAWVDTAADGAARAMVRAAGYDAIPVVVLPGGGVLIEPSNAALATALRRTG